MITKQLTEYTYNDSGHQRLTASNQMKIMSLKYNNLNKTTSSK